MFKEFKNYVGISNEELSTYIEENNIDENDGMHIWFEFVITPFLLKSINNNEYEKIIKSFEFIEKCLNLKDKEITGVIEFSLLEGLVAQLGSKIIDLYVYCGDETLKSINVIKKYIISC